MAMETTPSPIRLWSAAESERHSDGYASALPSDYFTPEAFEPALEHDAEASERAARARTVPVARDTGLDPETSGAPPPTSTGERAHTAPVGSEAPPLPTEAGSDPRGHLWVTWGVYLCAGKPPLADIILSHTPDLTRCDSVIGLAIPAMSGHI